MGNIVKWYNNNRKQIWKAIFTVGIIGAIFYGIVFKLNDRLVNNQPQTEEQKVNANDFNSVTLKSNKSVITGQSSNNYATNKKNVSVIDEFISYCNSGDINKAYNLISPDCIDEMYKSVDIFKNTYYTKIFGNGNKTVNVENWINNIYKVNIKQSALSTGEFSNKAVVDYISVVKDNNGLEKLNINGYIGRNQLDYSAEKTDFSVKVLQRNQYMDYDIYTIEVTNNLEKEIALGNPNYLEMSYITDKSGIKYEAYTNEISEQELVIGAKQKRTIRIKYSSSFSSTKEIYTIVFPNIVTDYKEYSKDYSIYNKYEYISINIV